MITILLVEDEPDNVEIISELITAEGWSVVVAGNQADAVRLAAARLPHLILMDLNIPPSATSPKPEFEAGLNATREIKGQDATRQVPVIALTASAMFQEQQRMFDAGCDDLVTKPFNFDELLNVIRRQLDRSGRL